MDFSLYMEDMSKEARAELTNAGYEELTTPKEVDQALTREGTTLVAINSMSAVLAELHVQLLPIQFILIKDQII